MPSIVALYNTVRTGFAGDDEVVMRSESKSTSRPWAACQSMKYLREQQQRANGARVQEWRTKKTRVEEEGEEEEEEDNEVDGVCTTTAASLREWLPCLIPPALAVGVYANSLGGDFVHDDLSAITGNRDITDPTAGTWDFLYNDFWGTSLLDPRSHKSYRPLTILTFK